MNRREFISGLGGTAAWPMVARAQQGKRVRRVGVLSGGFIAESDPLTQSQVAILRKGLEALGWVEDRNLRMDIRFGGVTVESNGVYAAELVGLGPDVIVAQTAAAIRALQQQTQTIPIVITGAGDVSTNGIVKNVAHPEGNVTGVTNAFGSIGGKWVELLKEAAPAVQRIGVLESEISGAIRGTSSYLPSIEEAARTLGVEILQIRYGNALEIVRAIDAFAADPNSGLIILPPVPPAADRQAIFQVATQHRIPTLATLKFLASEGGLMAYATSDLDLWRRAVLFVDRLLRGAKVSELPVEFPTKFDLVINLKAAMAIGLTVPNSLQLLADEVIE